MISARCWWRLVLAWVEGTAVGRGRDDKLGLRQADLALNLPGSAASGRVAGKPSGSDDRIRGILAKIQVTKITIEHLPFLHRPSRSVFSSRLQLDAKSQIGIVIRCPRNGGRPWRRDIIRRPSPPTKPARLLHARILRLPRSSSSPGRRNISIRSPPSAVLVLAVLHSTHPFPHSPIIVVGVGRPCLPQAPPLLLGPRSLLLPHSLLIHNPRLHQHCPLPRDHLLPALHLVGSISQHLHFAQEHLLPPSKLVDGSLHLDNGVHADPCKVWWQRRRRLGLGFNNAGGRFPCGRLDDLAGAIVDGDLNALVPFVEGNDCSDDSDPADRVVGEVPEVLHCEAATRVFLLQAVVHVRRR